MHFAIMDDNKKLLDMSNSDIHITLAACLLCGGTLIWFHEKTKKWHYQIISAMEIATV